MNFIIQAFKILTHFITLLILVLSAVSELKRTWVILLNCLLRGTISILESCMNSLVKVAICSQYDGLSF